jgi:SAM-dependent methyltransferase
MHKEAKEYVLDVISEFKLSSGSAIEIGSLDVNGSIRDAFTGVFIGIDRSAGKGVDVVAEASAFDGDGAFDVAISMEALEHTPRPADIVECAERALKPGGRFIITCAAPPRRPHGCDGRRPPPKGEHYRNINRAELEMLLGGWVNVSVFYDLKRGDLYATALKPIIRDGHVKTGGSDDSLRCVICGSDNPRETGYCIKCDNNAPKPILEDAHDDSDNNDRRSAGSVQALRTVDEPADPPA